jgi:hypothetical protein
MDQKLREGWHARERAFPIYPALHLAPEGLVLGAGTVVVPAHGKRQLTSLDGQKARVLALLSAGTLLSRKRKGLPRNFLRVLAEVALESKLRSCPGRGAGHEQTVLLRGPVSSSPPVALRQTAKQAPSAGRLRGH